MPEDDDKRLQLRALVALDQERAKTNDLSFAFLCEFKARERAEEQLRALQGIDQLAIRELREQLATSELMRAELSRELQEIRDQLFTARELATNAVREEYLALQELARLQYLSDVGLARLAALEGWLMRFGV